MLPCIALFLFSVSFPSLIPPPLRRGLVLTVCACMNYSVEEKMMTRYTKNISRGEAVEHRGMKGKIRKKDKQIQFSQCVKSPLIDEVAKDIAWLE